MKTGADIPLGLYIHWPFCARICPYCDFNVYRARNDDGEALVDALVRDLTHWTHRIEPRKLTSIHFGGGTPSLMSSHQIERVLKAADQTFGLRSQIEIGLEANPKEWTAFQGFAEAGINRLSIGVQSYQDKELEQLGRDHDGALARRSYDAARTHYDRVSLDIIYARPGQTLDQWNRELGGILSDDPAHLSAYQLTIEPGTAFERREARGELVLPEEAGEMYQLTQTMIEAAGLSAYEISNHAREIADQSIHNRLYWEGADWIGIGPGAHSRVGQARSGGRLAAVAHLKPQDYIHSVASNTGHTIETLTALEEAQERVLMGLRLSSGLDQSLLKSSTGWDVAPEALLSLTEDGFIVTTENRIRIAPDSRIYADKIANELAPGHDDH